DVIRLVWNTGEIELWGTDMVTIQEIFGGQYVRLRFFCDPEAEEQNGKIIWQRGAHKEPLVIATFNHYMDRTRQRGQKFIYNLRHVDFESNENTITPPPTKYLASKNLMKGKQNANTPGYSNAHLIQTK